MTTEERIGRIMVLLDVLKLQAVDPDSGTEKPGTFCHKIAIRLGNSAWLVALSPPLSGRALFHDRNSNGEWSAQRIDDALDKTIVALESEAQRRIAGLRKALGEA